jgi:hypothetical protein
MLQFASFACVCVFSASYIWSGLAFGLLTKQLNKYEFNWIIVHDSTCLSLEGDVDGIIWEWVIAKLKYRVNLII